MSDRVTSLPSYEETLVVKFIDEFSSILPENKDMYLALWELAEALYDCAYTDGQVDVENSLYYTRGDFV